MPLLSARDKLPSFAHSQEEAEIEALQTDVMRFMAILGFILSVIFALVQSIPFIPKSVFPTLEHYESLQADVENLKKHIQLQLDNLDQIRAQIQELEAIKNTRLVELQKYADDREKLMVEKDRVVVDLRRSQDKLLTVEHQLVSQETSLRTLRLKVENERRALIEVQSKIKQLRNNLLEIQQKDRRIRAQPKVPKEQIKVKKPARPLEKRKSIKPIELEEKPIKEPEPPPKRIGFTLKFESDQAFNRLLGNGFIKFYVFVGNKTWQVERPGRVIKFTNVKKPTRYHEMDRATVPVEYPKEFKRFVAAHGRGAATWGVALPEAMSRLIQLKIKDKLGGDLVIGAHGRITLKAANES